MDELFSNNYPGYEKLNSFSLRDACMDAGVRAQHGALAGKARIGSAPGKGAVPNGTCLRSNSSKAVIPAKAGIQNVRELC
jgi:hypothetical protein